jgi:hypothetical protein
MIEHWRSFLKQDAHIPQNTDWLEKEAGFKLFFKGEDFTVYFKAPP